MPQVADLLVAFLNQSDEFLRVRNAIADARVALSRAQRRGSATRAQAAIIEDNLLSLLADRQRQISIAADSEAFQDYAKAEQGKHAEQLAEWKLNQSLMERAYAILKRERIPVVTWDERQDPPVAVIIDLVNRYAAAVPPSGKLVLMGQEPLPASELFEAKPASATGLPKMFSGSVRLAVAVERDRGRNAEVQGAILARDHLIMPLGPDRKPLSELHWRVFDDILPFGARQIIRPRMPYAIPNSAIYSNLRLLLSRDSWRSIRDSAIDRHNGVCVICGNSASGEVRPEWTFHEPLAGSEAFGIQRLVDVKPYCSSCGGVFFPDINFLKVKTGPVGDFTPKDGAMIVNSTMRRLSTINRWETVGGADPLVGVVDLIISTFKRRSQVRWALDLTVLDSINISLNSEMIMHPRGWIMRAVDVSAYENSQPVHMTRIFGCNFVNSDQMRYFFAVPDIHEVAWGTKMDEVWLPNEFQSSPPTSLDAASLLLDEEPAGPLDPDSEDVEVEEGPPIGVFV